MSAEELLAEHGYSWLILCGKCAFDLPEEMVEAFYLARNGPQGEGECGILICVPWTFRSPYTKSDRFLCDSCGTGVAVARSSNWFIEKHKEERHDRSGAGAGGAAEDAAGSG